MLRSPVPPAVNHSRAAIRIVVLTLLPLLVLIVGNASRTRGETASFAVPQSGAGSQPTLTEGQPYLSEVAPASGRGGAAWAEILIEHAVQPSTFQVFLPLVTRDGALAAENEPLAALAVTTVDLSGWQLSDEDGNSYSIPASLPPMPVDGKLVVFFDGRGPTADELDWSDGVATLHTPAGVTDVFEANGDQLALYNTALRSARTLVDFVAWGQAPGADQDNAVAAAQWTADAFVYFDGGFGAGGQASPSQPNDSMAVWQNLDGQGPLDWASYFAANSSRGRLNPLPASLHSTVADGAELSADTLGVAWMPLPGAAEYEFELATTPDFATPLVRKATTFPGWRPTTPLEDGTYYWRVRGIDALGKAGPYYGPLKIVSVKLSLVNAVTLLETEEHKLQHKDSTMLDIGGGQNNSPGKGSKRTGDADRWDGEHLDANGEPNFSWNGFDNWYCVRASTAMLNDYYGGNLSQDRISYHIFEEYSAVVPNNLGVPEHDLGFSSGIGYYADQEEAVSWALGTPITGSSYCPSPPGYTCGFPAGTPKIDFATVKGWIDAGRPFMSINLNNAHARVVDGYWEIGSSRWVRILDPVPPGGGSGSGARWESFATFANDHERAYVGPVSAPNVRNDEASLHSDSDGDGINNFDETVRFKTNPYDADSDDDLVKDKSDLAEYVFDQNGSYQPRSVDFDNDSKRKEADADNDADGVPDGCEDVNGNGVFDAAGETNNFSSNSKQTCQPRFAIIKPVAGQAANAGDHNAPEKVLIRLNMELPGSLPNPPTFTAAQFKVKIGGLDATNITGAQVGQEFWLLVQAPAQSAASFYQLDVTWDNKLSDTEANAVYYIPRPRMDTVVVFDTSGSMADVGKLPSAKNAARLYIDQWSAGDSVGLVTFDDTATVASQLQPIVGVGQVLSDTKQLINGLTAGGQTAMGSGLQLGQTQLTTKGGAEHDWSIMLLTDGQENVAPYWSDPSVSGIIIPSKTVVQAIGLGPSTSTWFGLLQQIAGATGGSFGAVYEPSSLNAQSVAPALLPASLSNQLADSYKYAAEQILGEQRLYEALGTVQRGESETLRTILGKVPSVVFTANFDRANVGALEVYRPDNTRVNGSDTGVEHRRDATHEQFRILNPAPGLWRFVIRSVGSLAPTEYIFFGAADAPLTLNLVVGDQVGQQVPVIALLADRAPVLGASVNLTVISPNGRPGTPFALLDDGKHGDGAAGDGIYGGSFAPIVPGATVIPGTFLLKASASGNDNDDVSFTRHAQTSFTNCLGGGACQ